jgi:hypothetical protein
VHSKFSRSDVSLHVPDAQVSYKENCVHQFNRPDDSLHGMNAPSLDMEIAFS